MDPFRYCLCQNDRKTKQRHIRAAHKTDSDCIQFATIDQFEAKEAVHLYEMACKNRVAKNGNTSAIDLSVNSCLSSDGSSENETFPAENPFGDDSNKLVSECKITENKKDKVANDNGIEAKLDTVIGMLENLSTKVCETKQSFPEMSVVVK